MTYWLCLITSLPTENATVRMRTWRTLKASGAAVLRDGVYLMPEQSKCRAVLDGLATDVREGGGTALVLRIEEPEGAHFTTMFDRREDYAALLAEVAQARTALALDTVQDTLKQARKLRKAFGNLAEIDFFPEDAQRRADAALQELELACARTLSPDEPQAIEGRIERLVTAHYQGRLWATRQRPWVDRLASAWLIQRFIDPQARICWIASAQDCPEDALGFDFDGAAFSHIGSRVTFEVLLASFGLAQPALIRLGQLVHYLDVGGAQPLEAAGVESILAGLRETIADDDRLLGAAHGVFDGLLVSFNKTRIP
ncbi:MAG: Chromate resistance exported protein [Polaromonas sp.]|nr:Chromate resistance exported protein [Polaromonas sp.]